MADISGIIDSMDHIRPDLIRSRELRTILVYDIFRRIEAEWLSKAITTAPPYYGEAIVAIAYDKGRILDEKYISPTRDAILEYVLDKNLQHTILTDRDNSFIIYFSQFRDFFLYCGSTEFLKIAFPVSSETIKYQYFENLGDNLITLFYSFVGKNTEKPANS